MAFTRIGSRAIPAGQLVTVKFSGAMEARLKDLVERGKNLKTPMKRVSKALLRSTDRNFVAQGRIDEQEGVWQPLAPSTIRRRRKKQQRGKIRILRDTGRLKNASKAFWGDFHAGVKNNTPYAADHNQQGRWGNVLIKTETTEVPQHTRVQMVRQGYDKVKSVVKRRKQGPKQLKRPRVKGVKKRTRKRKSTKQPLVEGKVIVLPYTLTMTSRLPARPFMRIHNQDIEQAVKLVKEWLLKQKTGRRR